MAAELGFSVPRSRIRRWFLPATGVYLLVVLAGFLASIHWQHHFNFQLSSPVLADVLALGLLMFAGGGVGSGLGTLLLVSLATASLVGRGRLVLFYAALATLVTLGGQVCRCFRTMSNRQP